MTQGVASLHKILKDEKRRKIISLLQEKSSLSYSDLKDASGIASTGQMNYHLKILGDLLEKNQGQYVLSEKGKLAYRVLADFPQGPVEQAYKWKRLLAQIIAIVNSISLVVATLLFFIGNIDWRFYSSQMIYSLVAFLVAFIIFKFPTTRPKYDPNQS